MTIGRIGYHGLRQAALVGLLTCLLCATATAGSPTSAHTQNFAPSPGMRFGLDLDSKEGVFSSWEHRDLSGLTALRTALSLVRTQQDPKWLPGCWIILKDKDNQYLRQLMFGPRRQGSDVEFTIYDYKDNKRATQTDLGVAGKVGGQYQLMLSWATPGRLDIWIDGKAMPAIQLPSAVGLVELGGSTGECKFDPLAFGSLAR